jgi:hypothetical protein
VYSAEVLHQQEQDGEDDDYELVVELALDERRYHVLERSEWRRAEQRLDTHYLFVADDGARYASSIEQRYLLLGEIPALLDACGFDLTQLDGGFAGEPVDGESDTLVVVATKR